MKIESIKTIEVMGIKWTVLDKTEKGYLAIGDSIGRKVFGRNNDWKESDIRKFLNTEVLERLEKELNIQLPEFERNLLSLDGQTEYGTCMDKVSMITVDEYRKYRSKLPNTGEWWWTITPDSTPYNDDETWIAVVSSSGFIVYDYYSRSNGVRPICIFPFSIFEFEEK